MCNGRRKLPEEATQLLGRQGTRLPIQEIISVRVQAVRQTQHEKFMARDWVCVTRGRRQQVDSGLVSLWRDFYSQNLESYSFR